MSDSEDSGTGVYISQRTIYMAFNKQITKLTQKQTLLNIKSEIYFLKNVLNNLCEESIEQIQTFAIRRHRSIRADLNSRARKVNKALTLIVKEEKEAKLRQAALDKEREQKYAYAKSLGQRFKNNFKK